MNDADANFVKWNNFISVCNRSNSTSFLMAHKETITELHLIKSVWS